ncbi:uncharacterized protein B0H64DRAFT_120838 [Chaetomium fimeti]|uniref:J domain-containing protein n=1 Tax=Chaetomium fimeti TaxID=1854472 RepID=A0AAE0HJ41_9PEZI|nr:hypothetical protein B0H64DRAFT_120838 [Chaetomium fimeti]
MTSSLPPDPWKALGIERNADKSEIRTAYRKLVLKCHPDKIQDPTLKALKADEFQKVQQAWELLNDDAEKAKYEQKLRLAELQRAAKVQQDVKNSPNTSVPRSSKHATYEVRTAEPASRYKSSSKVYTYSTTHTRSHEEMPSSRGYNIYEDVDKQARRAASYEKPSKRDDERRERDRDERRRRREDEAFRLQEKERERDRERERERKKEEERERKAEKKRLEREREKEREKDRKRDAEDKARRHKPYVEHYETYMGDIDLGVEEIILQDEEFVTSTSKPEKKRSSSRKHDETRDRDRERERDRDRDRERERDKSSSRRAKSPHANSERKHINLYESAASYLVTKGSAINPSTAFWKSQTPPEPSYITPLAPTPPPADFEDDSILKSASRAAGRRASNDPARSREKLKYEPSDVTPTARPVPPSLPKSYSTPPIVPESPPRVSRSQTTPHDSSYRTMPHLPRTQTWAPGSTSTPVYYADIESEDDRDRDRRRRSRRTRSPSGQSTRYKVDSGKTSKLDSQYSYGESPTSTRRYAGEEHLGHSPSSATYASAPFSRVKQSKSFGVDDVKYAQYDQPAYYSSHGMDGYTAKA